MVEQFVLGNAVSGQVRVQILLFQANISRITGIVHEY